MPTGKDKEGTRRVVIVEDEAEVARVIERVLAAFAVDTTWCRTGGELLRRLRSLAPDLCIIDLGLPDMDGLELMQRLRSQCPCGILILTGRSHVSDRVMGLELGADDYVVKPFEPRELVARVRSILRRREDATGHQGQVAAFGGWRFNPGNNALRGPGGAEEILSTAEGELLQVFLRNPNRILNREQLMGSRDVSPTDRAIDVRISRLRRRLEPQEGSPALIKTVYGAGYLFLARVHWDDTP
ncbi:MAG: response regulator transcription factor [Rhodocyclaceae bacterium]|nr:response regulator transcription factor [Rhodocyclaceae bacterium]